ncbi:hypothetical protein C8R48DRAFT_728100 [Suillus tomentosus]|nr:hypothetical protein C8R48DRAFT_728100 [Suillus tomentosus]
MQYRVLYSLLTKLTVLIYLGQWICILCALPTLRSGTDQMPRRLRSQWLASACMAPRQNPCKYP